jgi:hypothetical protein
MAFKNMTFKSIIIFSVLTVFLFSCFNGKRDIIIEDTLIETSEKIDTRKDTLIETKIFDTNIKIRPNSSPNILLKTRKGCSQTGFNLKRNYYSDFTGRYNIFVVSTIDDLNQIKDKYIILKFLDTFSRNFFDENYLVLVLANYDGSSEYRNERIEQNNGQYSFYIDYWSIGKDVLAACAYTALYILEIPKK